MTDNDKLFIGNAISHLNNKHIEVIFSKQNNVYQEHEKIKCTGYFDCKNKSLVVATGLPQKNWLPVFLHEYSHFIQWLNKDKLFYKLIENKNLQNYFWYWLQGQEIRPKSKVIESARAIQTMEYECEKIVFNLLQKNKLSILYQDYVKYANIDVLFYNVVLKYRRWYDIPPHTIQSILDIIPIEPIDDITKVIPLFNELVLKNCFK
jgi:hypothetical protein